MGFKEMEYLRPYKGGAWFGSGNGLTAVPSPPPGTVLLESFGEEKAHP